MKAKRVESVAGVAFLMSGIFLGLTFLSRAQMQASSGNAALATSQNDSVVQVIADEEGLQLVPPNQIPKFGTFWIVSGTEPPPPYPFLPPQYDPAVTPVYALGPSGQFLVDAPGGATLQPNRWQAMLGMSSSDLVQEQMNTLRNLISQIQDAEANRMLARVLGSDALSSGEDGLSPMFNSSYTIDTNGLWLEITNVLNGLAYLNLHHGTNYVYEIFSKRDLLASNWDIETEVFPGTNQDVMPFTVSELDRTNLFIWARDWTGITSGGNTVQEWWLWEFFHTVNLSDTNLDSVGNTLLEDYQNDVDPNVIQFSLQFTNTFLKTAIAYGSVTIQSGVPYYIAVLVNDTNEADAVWQPYTSTNVVVSLNSGNGVYDILIGLRGLPVTAKQAWVETHLTLNNIAPVLTVTNPTAGTLSVPMIQLQGYVSASLSQLTFSVSNASGVFSNQAGYWRPELYDTNLLVFTTNIFQCYDIRLTNGLNQIALYATDVAGNTATTNVNYTLDYSGDHTAPVLSFLWPTNGTSIAGSNFTLQAQVDDATATVTTSINSNTVAGLVERSGVVWFKNLPLNSGSNTVIITATDAAGNMSITNLDVVQSTVSLTIDPISNDQVNQTNVTVTGTVSDPSDQVWVNGVQASVGGGGNWTANNVPVSPTGMASLNARVTDSEGNLLAAQNAYQPQPAKVVLANYNLRFRGNFMYSLFVLGTWGRGPTETMDNTIYWSFDSGGAQHYDDDPHDIEDPPLIFDLYFSPGINSFSAAWEYINVSSNYDIIDYHSYVDPFELTGSSYNQTQTHVMIVPSGPAVPGQNALYLVSAQVIDESSSNQVPASQIHFENQLSGTDTVDVTNSDGSVWSQGLVSAPSGTTPQVTPQTSLQKVSFNNMQVSNLTLQIFDANTQNNVTDQTNSVIVGQQISLFCELYGPIRPGLTFSNFSWTMPGITFSNYIADSQSGVLYTDFPTNNQDVVFYWADGGNARVVQCSAKVYGQTVTAQTTFNVLRPTATIIATGGTVALDRGQGNYYNDTTLHLGIPQSGLQGITFSETISAPPGYSGNINLEWVQKVSSFLGRVQTNDTPALWYRAQATNVLDKSYPYVLDPTLPSPGTSDSPSSQGLSPYQAVSFSDSFDMWLMFKPDGARSQWVPLRKVSWHWDGAGTKNGITWTLDSHTDPGNPNDTNTTAFPTWTDNATNHLIFQPE